MYNLKRITIKNFLSIKDIEYMFSQDQPFVIIGQNLDNKGQKGNGSGKSSFIEAIAFAITGLTLRDVPIKKLVRRGERLGTVEIELLSDKGDHLIIERTVDAKASKSTTILFNKIEEHKNLPDENSRNQWIMNEIGITKEDFFQFYLVTRSRYKPFFLQSDNEKKSIINRFSGADMIDDVYPYIDVDSKQLDKELTDLKIKLTSGENIVAFMLRQLEDLKNQTKPAYSETEEQLEAEIARKRKLIENQGAIIVDADLTINKTLIEIKALRESNYDDLIKQSQVEKESLTLTKNTLTNQITPIVDQFDSDCSLIKFELKRINNEINKLRVQHTETIDISNDLKNKIKSAIECPKCHHEFVVDDDFDIEEGKDMLKDCETIIVDLKIQINDFQDGLKHADKTEELRLNKQNDIQDIETEISQINLSIGKLDRGILLLNQQSNERKLKISTLENKIKFQESSIEAANASVKRFDIEIVDLYAEIEKVKNFKPDQQAIDKMQVDVDFKISNNEDYKSTIIEKETEKQSIDEWYGNFKNFKSSLANQSIDNIQQYTNLYLQTMDSDITIRLEGYKQQGKVLKEQIDVIIQRDGFDIGSYGEFSGGEQGRIDFANILAKQTLINLNSHNGLNFVFIDEVMETLDSTGIELIIQALKKANKPLMLVSQQEINSLSKNTITMVKEKGITTLKKAA